MDLHKLYHDYGLISYGNKDYLRGFALNIPWRTLHKYPPKRSYSMTVIDTGSYITFWLEDSRVSSNLTPRSNGLWILSCFARNPNGNPVIFNFSFKDFLYMVRSIGVEYDGEDSNRSDNILNIFRFLYSQHKVLQLNINDGTTEYIYFHSTCYFDNIYCNDLIYQYYTDTYQPACYTNTDDSDSLTWYEYAQFEKLPYFVDLSHTTFFILPPRQYSLVLINDNILCLIINNTDDTMTVAGNKFPRGHYLFLCKSNYRYTYKATHLYTCSCEHDTSYTSPQEFIQRCISQKRVLWTSTSTYVRLYNMKPFNFRISSLEYLVINTICTTWGKSIPYWCRSTRRLLKRYLK